MDKDWKKEERAVAQALGGHRSINDGSDKPDVNGAPGVSVEVKLQHKLTLRGADLAQAKRNEIPGTSWVMTLRRKGASPSDRLAVMPFDFFVDLYWRMREQDYDHPLEQIRETIFNDEKGTK